MDQTLILELSSDDEVGFDDSSTADNFDWITKLLDDVVADNDHDPDHPISDGGLFNVGGCIGGGGDGGGDKYRNEDDDDSEDVVVVGENTVQNSYKTKALAPKTVDDDDDDCVMLEGDPDKPIDEVKEVEEDSDELLIVGETGQVACRDYPHPRHLCAKFPFSSTPHESRCDMCHCYVCDSLAPCTRWGSGVTSIDHCHATDKEECWKLARKKFRQLKNPLLPMPITKPGTGSLPQLPQLLQNSTGPNQFMSPTSTCRVPTMVGLPNISRNQRSSIGVATNRFPPHLVSRQLLRSCNINTQVQGNRGASLAPRMITSNSMFKRSGLTSRPEVANQPTHRALNNVTVEYFQPPNQQLTENLAENNSTISTVSSYHLDSNHSFALPSASSLTPTTFPLQLQEYSQAIQRSPLTPTAHFHGGHSAAVASDSLYAYASINQTQSVPALALPCNTNAQNSATYCSEQQSAATHSISGPNFSCSTPDKLSCITQRSHQTSAEQSYSSPLFPCSASYALNNVTKSCQLSSADNFLVQDEVPLHEYVPSIVQNVQPVDNSHSIEHLENLELDIENWLQSSEPILSSQEDSYLLDMNNQVSVPAAVDAGMLYFDIETSWKGG